MRINTLNFGFNERKLGLSSWLVPLLLLQHMFDFSYALAVPVKRDGADDLITALVASLESVAPVASQEGIELYNQLLNSTQTSPYTITQKSTNSINRTANLDSVRAAFEYGSPVAGGPSFPNGSLGIAKVAVDFANAGTDLTPEIGLAGVDANQAIQDAAKYNGLQTLDDYTQLYNGEWQNTLPGGPDLGVETNYTQDLLFSMQRLSASPYQIRRLSPGSDLPFIISDGTVKTLSTLSLRRLFEQGRLFYADYRDQQNLTSTGQFAAACDAYFYIHPTSGDFLPLAIRSNVGANLIYTPLDSPNDWFLAKMMYSANDFWFTQTNHLASTHQVVQIVWQAAIRSISQEHPVYAILNRLTYEVFSTQLLAEAVLFSTGGAIDLVFPFTGVAAQDYATYRYYTGAGRFQANYFTTDLETRGLINSEIGPALKSFPFYEDASVHQRAIRTFMTSFVKSYYSSDCAVAADKEIQAWVAESNGPAQVIDFPLKISTRDTLVDALTHIAHLVSTAHHAANTNELLQVSSCLPFSPPALYSALPMAKSNSTNPVDYLPPLDKVIDQFVVGALFARPLLVGTNRSLIHMFDDEAMLELMNSQTQAANAAFVESMKSFSAQVSGRSFDAKGLSQGMPFVWKALDPNVAPYSITI